MSRSSPKAALSLTPLPLDADSRTLRIAASLARFGLISRVHEGKQSAGSPEEGLAIQRIGGSAPRRSPSVHPTSIDKPGRLSAAIGAARRGAFGTVGDLVLYASLRAYFARRFGGVALRGDESLIYLHSYEYYGSVARAARKIGARIVYDAHDFYQGITPLAERSAFDRKYLMPFLRKREAACIAGADALVTVSEGTADLIEREFGRRPLVLRNGHDPRLDMPADGDIRHQLGLTPEDILVVTVGNYKSGMAFDSAIEALSLLPPNVHFAFLGRGYPVDVPAGFAGRLHVGMALPPRQVVPFIVGADIGLVAYRPISENYRHALPNGFFQVVAAGLPLIYPGLPEIDAAIGGRNVGSRLVDFSKATLANAVHEMIPKLRQFTPEVNRLARAISWEEDEKRLKALIQRLLPWIPSGPPASVIMRDSP